MKYLHRLAILALLTATPAIAAPFSLDPDSFRSWLNATRQTAWGDGTRIYFESLASCSYSDWSNTYSCYKSFVRMTDPRGSRICLAMVQWEGDSYQSNGNPRYGKGAGVRNISDCRWLKDPRFADR